MAKYFRVSKLPVGLFRSALLLALTLSFAIVSVPPSFAGSDPKGNSSSEQELALYLWQTYLNQQKNQEPPPQNDQPKPAPPAPPPPPPT